ncbi:hypothetical protein MBLNU459_g6624t1 [Dothideomycetes sp. NU459]
MSDSEDGTAGVPLIEPVSRSTSPEPHASGAGKRKRGDESETAATESKRAAKRKKSKKPKDISDEALDEEKGVNHAIAHMDSQLLADHIAQRTKRFQTDLSTVELEDLRVPATAILDTTRFTKPRDLDSLPVFLELFSGPRRGKGKTKKKLSDAVEAAGTPHTLVVAGSGLRAAELTRALRKFQTKDAFVAKLFAKHIKMKEAVAMCAKTRMGIGVGTPQRIADLLDEGALKTGDLERVVVDASHIDGKKRGVLDMRETEAPLVKLLCREDFKERFGVEEGKIDLIFF